ncbi:MAG TPA: hypothetical protein VK990_02340, partial [Acidimicrobiia bacterium]|nr:hypothetical protein [Acidimicrobiia bacterium]
MANETPPHSLPDLADRFWMAFSEYKPTIATVRGEHRFDDQLPMYNEDWMGRLSGVFADIGASAEAIDPDRLGLQDRITRDLLIHESGVWAEEID